MFCLTVWAYVVRWLKFCEITENLQVIERKSHQNPFLVAEIIRFVCLSGEVRSVVHCVKNEFRSS